MIDTNVITYSFNDGKNYTRKQLIAKARQEGNKIDWKNVVRHLEKRGSLAPLGKPMSLGKKQEWSTLISTMNKFKIKHATDPIGQPNLVDGVIGILTEQGKGIVADYDLHPGDSTPLIGIRKGAAKPVGEVFLAVDGEGITLKFEKGIPNLDYSGFKYEKQQWIVPRYKPTIRSIDKDDWVINALKEMLNTGKYPVELLVEDASKEFSKLWNEIRKCYDENYFGSGNFYLQLARKAAVDKVAARASMGKMNQGVYNTMMNKLFPIKCRTFSIDTKKTSEQSLLDYSEHYQEPLFRINQGSDAGPLFLRDGVPAKCGEVIEQMEFVYNWFMEKMRQSAPVSDYEFLSLVLMKPKEEVYARKKGMVRNIYAYNNPAMRLAMMFYNVVATDVEDYGPDNETIVISGKSLFKGGMNDLIKAMMFRARRDGAAYAVYSDNLTIVTFINGVPVLISLDGEKFEASITAEVIENEVVRMVNNYTTTNNGIDPVLANYMLTLFPMWARHSVAVLGDQQIPTNQLASGTVGTFRWNSVTMIRLVSQFSQRKIEDLFDFSDIDNVTFLPKCIEIMNTMGATLTIESSTPLISTYGSILPVDILGFDALLLDVDGQVRYVPVLQRPRLIKMLTFAKTDTQDDSELDTSNKWRRWMVEYSRMIAAYLLGGWSDPVISSLIYKVLKQLFAVINTHLGIEQGKEDIKHIIDAFINDLESIDETNVLAPFFKHITNDESKLIVPTLTQVYLLAVGPHGLEEFIKKQIANGTPYAALLTPDEMETHGIDVKHSASAVILPQQAKHLLLSTLGPLLASKREERPNLNYAMREYKPPKFEYGTRKPVTREPSKEPTNPARLELLRKAMAKFAGNKQRKLALLVPTPGTHKLSQAPIERVSKLAWTNLYKDLANFFKVKFLDLKPYHKILGGVLLPVIDIPPVGYTTIKGIHDFFEQGDGIFQFDYGGYTHPLVISETTSLAPKINYSFYAGMGVGKEKIKECITQNVVIEFSYENVKFKRKAPPKPLPVKTVEPQNTTINYMQKRAQDRGIVKQGKTAEKLVRVTKAVAKLEQVEESIQKGILKAEAQARAKRKEAPRKNVKFGDEVPGEVKGTVDIVGDMQGKYEAYLKSRNPEALLRALLIRIDAPVGLDENSLDLISYMSLYIFKDLSEDDSDALQNMVLTKFTAMEPTDRHKLWKRLESKIPSAALRPVSSEFFDRITRVEGFNPEELGDILKAL